MAYQMAATAVTVNDLEGHSPVAGLFKCNLSNICAEFYTISTEFATHRAGLTTRLTRLQPRALTATRGPRFAGALCL